MDKAAASRIQSAGARGTDGGTRQGSFAARAQSAADRRQADYGSKDDDSGLGYLLWPIGAALIATLIWKAVHVKVLCIISQQLLPDESTHSVKQLSNQHLLAIAIVDAEWQEPARNGATESSCRHRDDKMPLTDSSMDYIHLEQAPSKARLNTIMKVRR